MLNVKQIYVTMILLTHTAMLVSPTLVQLDRRDDGGPLPLHGVQAPFNSAEAFLSRRYTAEVELLAARSK